MSTSHNADASEPAEMLRDLDIARMCQISAEQVRRLVRSNQMPPPIKIGSLNRWPRESIKRWIAGGCAATDSNDDRDFTRTETP